MISHDLLEGDDDVNYQTLILIAGVAILAAYGLDKSVVISERSAPVETVSVSPSEPDQFRVVSGRAHITDGDTIRIGKTRVRFDGIAAPEKNDRGGRASTSNLKRLIDGMTVECRLTGAKSYKRYIGTCYANDRNLSELQVASGHALDCPRFSNGRYAGAEATAKNQGHNLSAIYDLPSYCNR